MTDLNNHHKPTVIDTDELKANPDSPTQECSSEGCDRKLLARIHKASRQTEVYLDGVFQPEGLSAREAHILGYVTVYGPCSISELMRVFGLKASTLTSMLDRLEKHDYVHRKTNPDDRRSLLIGISEKGKDKATHAYGVVDKLASDIMEKLTDEQVAGFEAVMDALNDVTNIKLR